MNGEQIKAAIKAIENARDDAVNKFEQAMRDGKAELIQPFSVAISSLREQCEHVWVESWEHPHNGDQYYDCKFCGRSRR